MSYDKVTWVLLVFGAGCCLVSIGMVFVPIFIRLLK